MKVNWKVAAVCIAIPLLVGIAARLLTGSGMDSYATMKKPPLAPPGWLFPVVWTILYVLMGIASYRVLRSGKPSYRVREALGAYAFQLVFNFFWTLIFFGLKWYLFAFIWLVTLWILIAVTAVRFLKMDRIATYLLIPYLVWVAFAGYLNIGIALMN